ncbi:MAG: methyltransferase [Cyclobacteriaceae bacterium]
MTNSKFFEFADHLLTQFNRGLPIASTQILAKQACLFNLEPGRDYTDFKSLYDLAELAMNWHISKRCASMTSIEQITAIIDECINVLPNETERSVDQSIYQQFSTPLDLAWMMTLLAQVNQQSVVIDPSAGTGTLLSFLPFFKPRLTIANEISPFRNGLLANSGFDQCFKEDGTMIHFMPKFQQTKINTVIMNPPFSRSHLTGTKKDIKAGANHIIAAYQMLQPSGRLVLLINNSFTTSSKAFKHLTANIRNYHIPINAQVNPNAFKKKGTKFPTRIIVIDKSDSSAPLYADSQIDLNSTLQYLKLS